MVSNSDRLLFNYREETDRRLLQIESNLERLTRLVNQHLGSQSGATSSNMPHPALSAFNNGQYTFTNGTLDRTIDCDSTTDGELADLIYTIWYDLHGVLILG